MKLLKKVSPPFEATLCTKFIYILGRISLEGWKSNSHGNVRGKNWERYINPGVGWKGVSCRNSIPPGLY